jgi:hypothetical protein
MNMENTNKIDFNLNIEKETHEIDLKINTPH